MEFYDYDVTKCAVILRSSLAVVLSDPMVNNYNLFAQKGKSSAFTGYLAGNSHGKTWKFHIQNLLINCFYKI